MQIKLNNSTLTLLIPKDYSEVENAEELYEEMYHQRCASDIRMFQNVAGMTYGNTVISHIEASDAMPFGDKQSLIKTIHDTLADNQGLIEVETGNNPRGFEYIYSIIKTYHQDELNVNYCLRMNIKQGNEIIEVLGSFFESRDTGLRSAMGWNLGMSAGFETEEGSPTRIKGWWQDPYDPDYKKGCLMLMCERKGLDGLFPDDPLTQARELVFALAEDSYYKTRAEIEAENKEKEKASDKKQSKDKDKTLDEEKANENNDEKSQDSKSESQNLLRDAFEDKVGRAGGYKVEVDDAGKGEQRSKISLNPVSIVKAASKAADGVKSAVAKTSEELSKVKTPFDIPDDFRCKLNQPVPKELPGWGKREFIGFGKGTYAMSGVCLSWPVTEEESLPLNDTKGLIQQFHNDMGDNQGLISAKCGLTPKGNRYAYAIRKMMITDENGEAQGLDYELNFNIRINGRIHFINGSFQENDHIPGSRGGSMYIMKLGSSEMKLEADEWSRDPYDAQRNKGLLMNWIEDEKYDGLFPKHPLSEMRYFVKYVIENN